MNTSQEWLNDLRRMNELLDSLERDFQSPDDDGDDDVDDDPEALLKDLFPSVYRTHVYEVDGPRRMPTHECGSCALDTPRGLYRILYLAKPQQVNFTDMYKSKGLFALVSPDYKFVAEVQFYKYELTLYFSATGEYLTGRTHNVQSGVPGTDNGLHINAPDLQLWCDTLKRCLDRQWCVYCGNDFVV